MSRAYGRRYAIKIIIKINFNRKYIRYYTVSFPCWKSSSFSSLDSFGMDLLRFFVRCVVVIILLRNG